MPIPVSVLHGHYRLLRGGFLETLALTLALLWPVTLEAMAGYKSQHKTGEIYTIILVMMYT
jgi:hypothetical protein